MPISGDIGDASVQGAMYVHLAKCDSISQLLECIYSYMEKVVEYTQKNVALALVSRGDLEQFLEQNYANAAISMDMMTEKLGISYTLARQLFKKYFGCTFVSCLNKYRIEKAKGLLSGEQVVIKSVAIAVGYNNDQSLTRFFKKYEGITPGEYRQNVLVLKSDPLVKK